MTLVFRFPISGGETSIGEQVRSGDAASSGAGQIRYEAGDLVCITITLKGCNGNKRLGEVAVGGIRIGINRARLNVVNRDSTRTQVPGESLREAGNCAFRERIARTADERHALAVGTANVNDTPAFAQMPRGFLCRNEQPPHIDGDQLLEIFKRKLLNGREDTG